MPNPYAVVSAVVAGAGYSVLPRSLCEEHLAAGRPVLLHDPAEAPLNTLFLVQCPGADANRDVVRVRDLLQQAARTWGQAAPGDLLRLASFPSAWRVIPSA